MDGELCPPYCREAGISFSMDQSDKILGVTGSRSARTHSSASELPERETNGFLQKGLQLGGTSSSNSYFSNYKETNLSHQDVDIKIMKKNGASDEYSSTNSLRNTALEVGADNSGNVVSRHVVKSDRSCASLLRDEEDDCPASTVAEMLWDGSLLLDSSVTVSVVAYFKSGERIPDVNWTGLIEVKGKVRLESFEKFIQDLPRSRNRGLMVVSLCWKNGSSETGFKGMKEVAKKYQEGKKVGRAPISAGVDLYICPRSEAIITLLAKHGFFKGMVAIEDNQDSLIGCVVWRKNPPVNSILKKPERNLLSLRPVNSASPTTLKQAAQLTLSDAWSAQNSRELASVEGSLIVENEVNHPKEDHNTAENHTVVASKSFEGLRFQVEGCNSSTIASSSPAPPVPSNCPSTLLGPQPLPPSMSVTTQSLAGHMIDAKSNSRLVEPKKHFEVENPVLSRISDVTKPLAYSITDDDLPEFDFRSGHSVAETLSSKPLDAVTLDKRLGTDIDHKNGGLLPRILLPVKAMPFPKHGLENTGHAMDTMLGMPPAKRARESESYFPLFKQGERKNLFDDDDDMPEWQPPADMPKWRAPAPDLQKESKSETIKSSNSLVLTGALDTNESLHWGLLQNALSSSADKRPPFPSQANQSAYSSSSNISVSLPSPVNGHTHMGSNPSVGISSSPQWRSPLPGPSDPRRPIHPPAWSHFKPW